MLYMPILFQCLVAMDEVLFCSTNFFIKNKTMKLYHTDEYIPDEDVIIHLSGDFFYFNFKHETQASSYVSMRRPASNNKLIFMELDGRHDPFYCRALNVLGDVC